MPKIELESSDPQSSPLPLRHRDGSKRAYKVNNEERIWNIIKRFISEIMESAKMLMSNNKNLIYLFCLFYGNNNFGIFGVSWTEKLHNKDWYER